VIPPYQHQRLTHLITETQLAIDSLDFRTASDKISTICDMGKAKGFSQEALQNISSLSTLYTHALDSYESYVSHSN
jgi:hypothetical protein